MNSPWIKDIICEAPGAPLLTVEQFTSKYFPQYVKAWVPDHRIKLNKHGHPVRMSTKGDVQSQATRRARIITTAYAQYTFLKLENDKIQSPRAPQSETLPAGIHTPGARGL